MGPQRFCELPPPPPGGGLPRPTRPLTAAGPGGLNGFAATVGHGAGGRVTSPRLRAAGETPAGPHAGGATAAAPAAFPIPRSRPSAVVSDRTDLTLPPDLLEAGEAGPGLWDSFRRHLALIFLLTGVGVGAGYLASLKQEPRFVSSVQLRVDREALPESSGPGGSRDAGPGLGTRMVELRSPTVLGPAITGHNLHQLPELADEESTMGAIAERLELEQVEESDVLKLSYSGESPAESEAVLKAVIDSYQNYLTAGYGEKIARVLEIMRQARGELTEELDADRQKLSDLKRASPLVASEQGTAFVSPHAAEMRRYGAERDELRVLLERNAARIGALEKARREQGTRAALTLLVNDFQEEEGTGPSKDVQIRNEIFPLLQEEQELLADGLGSKHPAVKRVRARIAATRAHMAEMLGEDGAPQTPEGLLDLYLTKLQLELQTAAAEAEALDARFQRERELAAADYGAELDINAVRKDIEMKEALLTSTVELLREVQLTPDDVKGFDVRLLSEPGPGQLSQAGLPLFLGAGGVAGFLLGYGLAFLLESRDQRFRDPSEVRSAVGAPVVGHVPVISAKVKRAGAKLRKLAGADEFVEKAPDPTLLTVHKKLDPDGLYTEAMRGVRASLFFSSRGSSLKVIQVTSPNPKDGKSTLSANLAAVVADSGRRTLLLDADFRKPKAHTMYGIQPNAPGVADVLAGRHELADALRDVGVPGLTVLPCGSPPGNAAELLDSDVFGQLLDVLREKYDFIIVDSPPVLAVADPLTIASRTDGVLLVMRLDGKTRSQVESTVDQLERVGGNLLGVVITGVTAGAAGGQYQYDSYGGYAFACGEAGKAYEKRYASYRTPAHGEGSADRVSLPAANDFRARAAASLDAREATRPEAGHRRSGSGPANAGHGHGESHAHADAQARGKTNGHAEAVNGHGEAVNGHGHGTGG